MSSLFEQKRLILTIVVALFAFIFPLLSYLNIISSATAAAFVTSVLAFLTFLYVLVTYSLVKETRKERERSDILNMIESGIDPMIIHFEKNREEYNKDDAPMGYQQFPWFLKVEPPPRDLRLDIEDQYSDFQSKLSEYNEEVKQYREVYEKTRQALTWIIAGKIQAANTEKPDDLGDFEGKEKEIVESAFEIEQKQREQLEDWWTGGVFNELSDDNYRNLSSDILQNPPTPKVDEQDYKFQHTLLSDHREGLIELRQETDIYPNLVDIFEEVKSLNEDIFSDLKALRNELKDEYDIMHSQIESDY